jgi:hypothetical protein
MRNSDNYLQNHPHSPHRNDSSGRRRVFNQFGGRHGYWLKRLPRCFLRRNLAHGLAKPYVPRVRSEPQMPDHQEMVMIVMNNHDYGAMKSFSRLLGDSEPPGIYLPGISYPDIARGFGAVGVEVTRSSDIYQALQGALQREGPTLIDIQIDPNAGDLY